MMTMAAAALGAAPPAFSGAEVARAALAAGCGKARGFSAAVAEDICQWNRTKHATSQEYIDRELKHGAWNYAPLPVIVDRGLGAKLWDVEGKEYLDFLSGICAVNQGHSHPRLVQTMQQQCARLALTSRAFYNSQLGPYEEFVTKMFGYDKVLPMNTGVEGGETAIKIARRWGYAAKGIPANRAVVLFPHGNYWGRTLAGISSSTNPVFTEGFGPFMPGFDLVPFNDLPALEKAFAADPNIAAYMVEPILGEGGVVVPDDGYLKGVRALCTKYNVLMIADEVQAGLGRAGDMLAHRHQDPHGEARADIVVLGKALSGGMYPVSAVLADDAVYQHLKPGQHGSTFGGNPLGCAVARTALEILVDENLVERSRERGAQLRSCLEDLQRQHPALVRDVRGRGLLQCIQFSDSAPSTTAWDVCVRLKEAGVVTRPVKTDAIRFSPPLVISEDEMARACDALRTVLADTPTA
ncbi:unnamed protein product [Pedinophyceae sp. YPF-701]|nr:unnamed protein product [Pedinophyceae sp. YPF-701]